MIDFYDIEKALQNKIEKCKNVVLFVYKDGKVSYQQIEQGDIEL